MTINQEPTPKTPEDPQKMLIEANKARESADFLGGLDLALVASSLFKKAGELPKSAEALSSAAISLRHLYENKRDSAYLSLALQIAQDAVDLAMQSGQNDALAIPYFELAKTQEAAGQLYAASLTYEKAFEHIITNPPKSHDRPGVKADITGRLAISRIKVGEEEALKDFNQALEDLEQSKEGDYNKGVWLSGLHMHLAEALKDKDTKNAQEHLQEARRLIDIYSLPLRLNQWQRLADTFPPKDLQVA